MKANWPPLTVAASLALLTFLSSCTTTSLKASAITKGQSQARINLPAWPADCAALEAHAGIKEGDEVRSVLIRERGQLDKANARVGRCAAFYSDLKFKMETP